MGREPCCIVVLLVPLCITVLHCFLRQRGPGPLLALYGEDRIRDLIVGLVVNPDIDPPEIIHKQEERSLQLAELLKHHLALPGEHPIRVIVIEKQGNSCKRLGQDLVSLLPYRRNHPHPRVPLAMPKRERKIPRLNVNFPCYHENRFKPDSLLPDVPLGTGLGAFANAANRHQVFARETVFIALDNHPLMVDGKRDIGVDICCFRGGIRVIVGVL